MYKVFFNDRIVFLNCTDEERILNSGFSTIISSSNELIAAWNIFIENESVNVLLLDSGNGFDLATGFFELFANVHAAGGVVENLLGQLLCIYRWGKWDLPKGKVEQDEGYEAAAMREVEEECGITDLKIERSLRTTYHLYLSKHHNNRFVIKHTHWYLMKYTGGDELKPQTDEEIEQAKWFDRNQTDVVLQNTYGSLKEMITEWLIL